MTKREVYDPANALHVSLKYNLTMDQAGRVVARHAAQAADGEGGAHAAQGRFRCACIVYGRRCDLAGGHLDERWGPGAMVCAMHKDRSARSIGAADVCEKGEDTPTLYSLGAASRYLGVREDWLAARAADGLIRHLRGPVFELAILKRWSGNLTVGDKLAILRHSCRRGDTEDKADDLLHTSGVAQVLAVHENVIKGLLTSGELKHATARDGQRYVRAATVLKILNRPTARHPQPARRTPKPQVRTSTESILRAVAGDAAVDEP